MGNSLRKSGRSVSDQFLSCSGGNRKKKKLAKLSNGGLQPQPTAEGPLPRSSPSTLPRSKSGGKTHATWTKQEEQEYVTLLSQRPLNPVEEATLTSIAEWQNLKEKAAPVETGPKDGEPTVQQSPKVMTAPPPSPAQQEQTPNSKPVLQDGVIEGRGLEKPTEEGEQCASEKTSIHNNSHNDDADIEDPINSNTHNNNSSICNGTDVVEKVIPQKKPRVKKLKRQKLEDEKKLLEDEKKLAEEQRAENFGTDCTPAILPEQDDPLKELENRQDAIFARLHKIQGELDKMSVGCDSRMTTTSQNTNGPSAKITFEDLVIGVDPGHLPVSLLVLYAQLSQNFKVKTSVFVHSTVTKPPMHVHLQTLLKSAQPARQPDDCRTTNDLLLTFIYKQVRQDCSLMINPERQTYIYGEVNVARYLSRLANPDYESNPVTSTQIDHWLDLASLMLWNGNGKAKSQMVQNIDAALTAKKKWLVGHDLSLADIIVWSGLHSANMMDKLPNNVQAWRKRCEGHPYFNLVNKIKK